jgi:hypothetical protein
VLNPDGLYTKVIKKTIIFAMKTIFFRGNIIVSKNCKRSCQAKDQAGVAWHRD